VNKPPLNFESVAEIQINNQPCKGINLITRYTQTQRAPRVATIHDVTKKSGRVLPRPSAVFHVYVLPDIPWVARTLSHFTSVKWGKVSSNSSKYETTQFGNFICPVCISTFKCLFIQTQPTWALINTSRDYHLEALNIRSDHSPSFPSSILHFSLIAPSDFQLCQPFDYLAKSYKTSINRKSPMTSGFQPLIFYR
jgi:hypothetical protein